MKGYEFDLDKFGFLGQILFDIPAKFLVTNSRKLFEKVFKQK